MKLIDLVPLKIREGFNITDKIYFDPNNNNKINIDTTLGKKDFAPRVTKLAGTNVTVLSAYSKVNKQENVDDIRKILNALKGKGDIQIDSDSYVKFIKRTAIFFYRLLKDEKIDTIITIESSAGISNDLKTEILKRFPYNPIVFDEGIKKNTQFADYIIDKEHISNNTLITLQKNIDKQKERGYFKIQNIPAQFRKFVRNWLKVDDVIRTKIPNKTILIIDDFLTSGSTLIETSNLISELGAKKIIAITILK